MTRRAATRSDGRGARGWFARPLVVALAVASIAGVSSGSRASAKDDGGADTPFSTPEYLTHITGHGTTSGGVKDDAWVMVSSTFDDKGNFEVADGSGGTYGYSSDSHSGPYSTPREACQAAKGKQPWDGILSFLGQGRDSFDCNAIGLGPKPASTTEPNASNPADTSAVTDTAATTPDQAPVCSPHGVVIDVFGQPVPDIHLRVEAGSLSFDVASLEDGTYSIPEIGDDPAGGQFDSRTDSVKISLLDEAWFPSNRFVVLYQQLPAVLHADDFLVKDYPDCARDFIMGALPDTYSTDNGPALDLWSDIIQIYQGIHRAWALADLMGVNVSYGLPLRVFSFCNDPKLLCTTQAFAFQVSTTSDGSQTIDRPYIAFGPATSLLTNTDWPDNREYHEFGHYFLAAAFAGQPHDAANGNHNGYPNHSSTDAWTEGFAEFYATMVSEQIDHRPRPELYIWAGGRTATPATSTLAPAGGTNLSLDHKAWDWPEEFAVASLLYQLVHADVTQAPTTRSKRVLRVDGFQVQNDPTWGPVVVGLVTNLTPDGPSVGTNVVAIFRDANGQPVDYAVGPTMPWNLDANGGRGVFVLPVKAGLVYKDIVVVAYEGRPEGPPAPPPPPLQLDLGQVWSTIANAPSTKSQANGHILDVQDLYKAFKTAYGGQGTVPNGLDSVDQMFVNHGFFADVEGARAFAAGDEIGLTSHPAFGQVNGSCPTKAPRGTCSTQLIPRTDLTAPPEYAIKVDTGAVDAHVYVHVAYPSPNQADSYGYLVAPDSDHLVHVPVPPASTGATVTLVALSDGYTPAVLGRIDATTFATDALRHPGESFLSMRATMKAGQFTIPDGHVPGVAPTPRTGTRGAPVKGQTGAGRTARPATSHGRSTTVWIIVAFLLAVIGVGGLVWATTSRRTATAAAATWPAPGSPSAIASGAWNPTHRAPAGGLAARTRPDPTEAPVTHLDAGLEVAVDSWAGAWAHVICSNGWAAWVDGRLLIAITT